MCALFSPETVYVGAVGSEGVKSLFNDTTRDLRDKREDQYADHYDNNNEDLNKAFEEWEILKALQNLKSNKTCGHD